VAAARAGVPQVITPMFSDQFYWGRRVGELGIGAVTPFAELEAEALGEVLAQALKPEVAAQAQKLAEEIVTDGAMAAARQLVEAATA
jgi:vancomycin aglycone glucosyltransferase